MYSGQEASGLSRRCSARKLAFGSKRVHDARHFTEHSGLLTNLTPRLQAKLLSLLCMYLSVRPHSQAEAGLEPYLIALIKRVGAISSTNSDFRSNHTVTIHPCSAVLCITSEEHATCLPCLAAVTACSGKTLEGRLVDPRRSPVTEMPYIKVVISSGTKDAACLVPPLA